MTPADLGHWYGPHLTPANRAWVEERRTGHLRTVAIAIGQVPRRLGNALLPNPAGPWPRGWRIDQAVRLDLAISLTEADLAEVFATADVEELIALYQGLSLLPGDQTRRAAEGVRSNMTAVFNAVALDNPYPAAHLDDGAFNQLTLKAVFTGADLERIHGLQARWNPDLQRMLSDLVRERTAAGRPIDPRVLALLG